MTQPANIKSYLSAQLIDVAALIVPPVILKEVCQFVIEVEWSVEGLAYVKFNLYNKGGKLSDQRKKVLVGGTDLALLPFVRRADATISVHTLVIRDL
jgi:hypothetical protein